MNAPNNNQVFLVYDNYADYYKRNTRCLGYHWSNSCVPIWNSLQQQSMQGVRIGAKHLLTAAHVAPLVGTRFIFTGHSGAKRGYERTVKHVRTHPHYPKTNRNADLAIVILDKALPSVSVATAEIAYEPVPIHWNLIAYHKSLTTTTGFIQTSATDALVWSDLGAVMNDSGCPIFATGTAVNDVYQPMLLSLFSGKSVGPRIGFFKQWIDSIVPNVKWI